MLSSLEKRGQFWRRESEDDIPDYKAPLLAIIYSARTSVAPSRAVRAARGLGARLAFVAPEELEDVERKILSVADVVLEAAGLSVREMAVALDRETPAGIITFSEALLGLTARLADELGLPHHALAAIPSITDKAEQRRALRLAGIAVPAITLVQADTDLRVACATMRFPLVVKPAQGAGSRNTVLVSDASELDLAVKRFTAADASPRDSELVVEEALVGQDVQLPWGDYMAVDCLVTPEGVTPLVYQGKFSLQEPFRERGGYTPPREDPELVQEVGRLAAAAVAAVGITNGIADVEIKLTPQGPRVIEVNGRLGAWVDDMSVRVGGPDMVKTALRAAMGDADPVTMTSRPALGRLAYYYVLVPPMMTVRFVPSQAMVDALRRIQGVMRVEIFKSESDCMTAWRTGPGSFAGAVVGHASSADELNDIVLNIEDAFRNDLARYAASISS